jgi:hypothetical protein
MIQLDLEAAGLAFRTEAGTRCFYALRNSYISAFLDAGKSIAQAQRLARHSDARLTMKYAKPRSDEWTLVDDLEYPGANAQTKSKEGRSGRKGRQTR